MCLCVTTYNSTEVETVQGVIGFGAGTVDERVSSSFLNDISTG